MTFTDFWDFVPFGVVCNSIRGAVADWGDFVLQSTVSEVAIRKQLALFLSSSFANSNEDSQSLPKKGCDC